MCRLVAAYVGGVATMCGYTQLNGTKTCYGPSQNALHLPIDSQMRQKLKALARDAHAHNMHTSSSHIVVDKTCYFLFQLSHKGR